jgi:hypothetical protein
MDDKETKATRFSWQGLPKDVRSRAVVESIIYALLVFVAFWSLLKQNEADLRGPKQMWKGVIPASIVNVKADSTWVIPVGPMLYFALGRRRPKGH